MDRTLRFRRSLTTRLLQIAGAAALAAPAARPAAAARPLPRAAPPAALGGWLSIVDRFVAQISVRGPEFLMYDRPLGCRMPRASGCSRSPFCSGCA
jgi:hypothetical protein